MSPEASSDTTLSHRQRKDVINLDKYLGGRKMAITYTIDKLIPLTVLYAA